MTDVDENRTNETPAVSPGSPFAEQFQVPQFGIIHLLAWGAVTAVLLKYSAIDNPQSSIANPLPNCHSPPRPIVAKIRDNTGNAV